MFDSWSITSRLYSLSPIAICSVVNPFHRTLVTGAVNQIDFRLELIRFQVGSLKGDNRAFWKSEPIGKEPNDDITFEER